MVRIRLPASVRRALGFAKPAAVSAPPSPNSQPESLLLARNGWVPNNDSLPVLIYRNAVEFNNPKRRVSALEDRFRRNWWLPQSLNSIYDFHHYHSTAHETLGVARGQGRLMLGGEEGYEITLNAGDVLVLPVGTGHCKLGASSDFLVVGAYPQDMDWDICRSAPTPEMTGRMRNLPFPAFDPVGGLNGYLPRIWAHKVAHAS